MTPEEKYKAELAENGVELPEEPEVETPEEKEPEVPAKEVPEADPDNTNAEKPKEPEQPTRKRSIYDDLKDERKERKDFQARAETAERERDELKAKVEEFSKAPEGRETAAAEKDLRAFAEEMGANPDLVDRIVAEARKGMNPELDPALKKDLDEFKAWKQSNSKVIEQQMFDTEFEKVSPSLKQLFGNPSEDELKAIKGQLDAISHTKDWHDKDLDYIAFKHQDALKAMVSPKKRGMESKGRQEADPISSEFDPNADYSKMTFKEREKWEEGYKDFTKSDGLITNARGTKTLI